MLGLLIYMISLNRYLIYTQNVGDAGPLFYSFHIWPHEQWTTLALNALRFRLVAFVLGFAFCSWFVSLALPTVAQLGIFFNYDPQCV